MDQEPREGRPILRAGRARPPQRPRTPAVMDTHTLLPDRIFQNHLRSDRVFQIYGLSRPALETQFVVVHIPPLQYTVASIVWLSQSEATTPLPMLPTLLLRALSRQRFRPAIFLVSV